MNTKNIKNTENTENTKKTKNTQEYHDHQEHHEAETVDFETRLKISMYPKSRIEIKSKSRDTGVWDSSQNKYVSKQNHIKIKDDEETVNFETCLKIAMYPKKPIEIKLKWGDNWFWYSSQNKYLSKKPHQHQIK